MKLVSFFRSAFSSSSWRKRSNSKEGKRASSGGSAETLRNVARRKATLAHDESSTSLTSAAEGLPAAEEPCGEVERLLQLLEDLRSHSDNEERMLVVEAEFQNRPVVVRDIVLDSDDESLLRRVDNRLQAALKMDHPNLNKVVYAARHGNRVVLMADKAVESVSDKIVKARSICFAETLTKEDAIEIGLAVSEAGAFLHRNGIHQLNLKPSSILVFGDNQFKLSESCFSHRYNGSTGGKSISSGGKSKGSGSGTAYTGLGGPTHTRRATNLSKMGNAFRILESNEESNSKTYPLRSNGSGSFGGGMGHAEYSAIAIFCERQKMLGKADIFCFGVLLWQLVHLKRPYPSEWLPMMILQDLQNGNRPHIDMSILGMDSPLRRLIQLCWTNDPRRRPSFEEITIMLKVAKQRLAGLRPLAPQGYSTTMMLSFEINEMNPVPQDHSPPPSPYAEVCCDSPEVEECREKAGGESARECSDNRFAGTSGLKVVNEEDEEDVHNCVENQSSFAPTVSVLGEIRIGERVCCWSEQRRDFFYGVVKFINNEEELCSETESNSNKPSVAVLADTAGDNRSIDQDLILVCRYEVVPLLNLHFENSTGFGSSSQGRQIRAFSTGSDCGGSRKGDFALTA